MAQLVLSLFLDGMMVLLLVLTIYYCWRLNVRIRVLQDSKSELARIITQFDESTRRATRGVAEIHEVTSRIAENIQHKIDKANYLADDLQFMIEKGNKMAEKLDGGRGAAPISPARKPTMQEPPSRRERESRDATGDGGEAEPRTSSLDDVLRRVSNRKPEVPAAVEEAESIGTAPASEEVAPARRRLGARIRSKSEQELFEALKTTGNKA